jgi:hypothetical protein
MAPVHRIVVALLLAGGGMAEGSEPDESAWDLRYTTDVMTDETRGGLCSRDSTGTEICFSVVNSSLYISIELSDGVFESNTLPDLRVDKNPVANGNALLAMNRMIDDAERQLARLKGVARESMRTPVRQEPRWVRWRLQDNTRIAEDGFVSGFRTGKLLRVRSYLHGGFQRDSEYSLAGFLERFQELLSGRAPSPEAESPR